MSEMSISEAAAEAGKWGNLVRALSKLQDTAEFLFAQMQNQSQRELALKQVNAEIAAAEAARDVVNAENVRLIEDAREQARTTIAEARQVQVNAAALISDAKEHAEALRVQADGAIVDRNAAVTETVAARAEHAALLKKLEDARAEGRRLFGS
jgi:hypothetical protein